MTDEQTKEVALVLTATNPSGPAVVPAGTFHGEDDIPAGTFHAA